MIGGVGPKIQQLNGRVGRQPKDLAALGLTVRRGFSIFYESAGWNVGIPGNRRAIPRNIGRLDVGNGWNQ